MDRIYLIVEYDLKSEHGDRSEIIGFVTDEAEAADFCRDLQKELKVRKKKSPWQHNNLTYDYTEVENLSNGQ